MMTLYHAVRAIQQTPREAIFAFVSANCTPAGDTVIMAQEVSMAIMTK
jgi:hypothetical protein